MTPLCVFIFNNLKVSPFIFGDAPPIGFELITYENESSTPGTLWDIGVDAGMTRIGNGNVQGQLWKSYDSTALSDLRDMYGVYSGLNEEYVVPVTIDVDHIKTTVFALTFILTRIQNSYKIVKDGNWLIKRN